MLARGREEQFIGRPTLPLPGIFFFCLCESDSAEAILGEGHEIAMHLLGAHNDKNLNWLDIACQ
jgi:hypothetical protein